MSLADEAVLLTIAACCQPHSRVSCHTIVQHYDVSQQLTQKYPITRTNVGGIRRQLSTGGQAGSKSIMPL